jgi:hypothetical protein
MPVAASDLTAAWRATMRDAIARVLTGEQARTIAAAAGG